MMDLFTNDSEYVIFNNLMQKNFKVKKTKLGSSLIDINNDNLDFFTFIDFSLPFVSKLKLNSMLLKWVESEVNKIDENFNNYLKNIDYSQNSKSIFNKMVKDMGESIDNELLLEFLIDNYIIKKRLKERIEIVIQSCNNDCIFSCFKKDDFFKDRFNKNLVFKGEILEINSLITNFLHKKYFELKILPSLNLYLEENFTTFDRYNIKNIYNMFSLGLKEQKKQIKEHYENWLIEKINKYENYMY